eukprot:SAG11_NODE_21221_length_429_cov_1.245455_2_plen_49_part_01
MIAAVRPPRARVPLKRPLPHSQRLLRQTGGQPQQCNRSRLRLRRLRRTH